MTDKFQPLHAEPLLVSEPWRGFVVRVGKFPLPPAGRESLREFISQVVSSITASGKFNLSTWIEMSSLHYDDGARVLAAKAGQWMPRTGLGFYLDREPPRLLTMQDFLDREWGQPLPAFTFNVFHITSHEGATDARDTMVGRGVVAHLLLDDTADVFHEKTREELLPRIREEAFRCYPLYFPLLDRDSVTDLKAETVWNRFGMAVYIRECFEKGELLLFGRVPLEPHFEKIGMRRMTTAAGEPAYWIYHPS